MSFTTKVVIRFAPGATLGDLSTVFDTPGVVDMVKVFADEPEGSGLWALYMLDVDSTRVAEVIDLLRWEPSIEFAEVVLPKLTQRDAATAS
jgi:hypothetical protein